MAFLKIVSGEKKGQKVSVDRDEIVIGRASENAVVLDDASVSGKHCKITRDGRRFTLYDLDSTNGTKLNNVSVHEHQLSPGDVVKAGSVELLFDGDDIAPYEPLPAQNEESPVTLKLPATGKAQGPPAFDARKSKRWLVVVLAVAGAMLIVGLMALYLSSLFGD